jgi:hypothetical protein
LKVSEITQETNLLVSDIIQELIILN